MAVAHNGNLVNVNQIRHRLEEDGAIFQSTSDTEVILHLLARCPLEDLDAALKNVLSYVHGAFSLVLLTREPDVRGARPVRRASALPRSAGRRFRRRVGDLRF